MQEKLGSSGEKYDRYLLLELFNQSFKQSAFINFLFQTWQDIKSKTKKRNSDVNRDLPIVTLTPAEQEVLGIKDSPRKSESPQPPPEFVQLDQEMMQDHNYSNDIDFTGSMSEPESPPETKVFTAERTKKVKHHSKLNNSKHSDCYFNCDALTNMEQKKLQVKEDYLKFKKDYLRQKLKLIKEQTEALKSIARELSK